MKIGTLEKGKRLSFIGRRSFRSIAVSLFMLIPLISFAETKTISIAQYENWTAQVSTVKNWFIAVSKKDGKWSIDSINPVRPNRDSAQEILLYPALQLAYEKNETYQGPHRGGLALAGETLYECKSGVEKAYSICNSAFRKFVNTDFFGLGNSRHKFDRESFEKMKKEIQSDSAFKQFEFDLLVAQGINGDESSVRKALMKVLRPLSDDEYQALLLVYGKKTGDIAFPADLVKEVRPEIVSKVSELIRQHWLESYRIEISDLLSSRAQSAALKKKIAMLSSSQKTTWNQEDFDNALPKLKTALISLEDNNKRQVENRRENVGANAAPLGQEIGFATLDQVKAELGGKARLTTPEFKHINGYGKCGRALRAEGPDVSKLNVGGLLSVLLCFDEYERLSRVVMEIAVYEETFLANHNDLFQGLAKKYKLLSTSEKQIDDNRKEGKPEVNAIFQEGNSYLYYKYSPRGAPGFGGYGTRPTVTLTYLSEELFKEGEIRAAESRKRAIERENIKKQQISNF